MTFFDRLKADASEQWADYTYHKFIEQLGAGTLPLASFKHYLVQDYLFLIQFARAYALGIYKGQSLQDMQHSLEGVKAILEVELELHLELCGAWGMDRVQIESAPEDTPTMAYTRFVLDAGLAGDLLDLQVALAPCVIGYAEIGARLKEQGYAVASNPYHKWIMEYSGEAYQDVANEFKSWLNDTSAILLTEKRYPRALSVFEKACRLESDFWQMGLNAQ